MTAARQRLRPIIMTSLAFGLGVVPLFIATGAGSGSQNAIGTSVVGGVVTATLLGIFFIPMFYIWVRSMFPHKYENNKPNNGGSTPGGSNPNNPDSPVGPTEYNEPPIIHVDDDMQNMTLSKRAQPASFGDNTQ